MNQGIYEELVTKLVAKRLEALDNDFNIRTTKIDKEEAAQVISMHLASAIKYALNLLKGDHQIEKQIEIANKLIFFLGETLNTHDFLDDLIETEGNILKAVFSQLDAHYPDLDLYLKEITPYTRLTQSELFTGGNVGLSLESELRKEILSSDRIDFLVSFIKWKGIVILENELKEFTRRGGKLRVITTTYMGASEYKAIEFLSRLTNSQVKISYNNDHERLHAKAYLFKRNSGFHTGYIGSSNFSRSALTDGLEWNLKITTKEVSHIIDKFQKTFDAYWENTDFELFDETIHQERLNSALKLARKVKDYNQAVSYFDIKPYPFQLEILDKLEVERQLHNRFKNLIVAATGTGKTVISAFDYKRFKQQNSSSRLLFVAHRKEILIQSRSVFQGILKNNNFGELWVDGEVPGNYEFVFASVQTLNNRLTTLNLSPEYYDYIVIDEVHHIAASSYRPIIQYFKPKLLLGLTATPERNDGADIVADFSNRIAAEIRLPEALYLKLLCPFQYFGVSDSVDLSNVRWERGRYLASELSGIYTANNHRVREIIASLEKYTVDINQVRALCYCVNIEHAQFMKAKFSLAGLKADCLTSNNTEEREKLREQLRDKKINYLFVVDIFNEGVDIPEVDTILFLRPTESLTVFLQQLGRGLRLSEGKEGLLVLDFVGNARPEYNFENKFRALIGKTTTPVSKEIEDKFPHLPLGCSIVLEKKAKEIVLENIRKATSYRKSVLIRKIRDFKHHSILPLTLRNFTEINNISIQSIYAGANRSGWKRLCQLAGVIPEFDSQNELAISRAIRKWLSTKSSSYFEFIYSLASKSFQQKDQFTAEEELMLFMLKNDFWAEDDHFKSLKDSIEVLGTCKPLVEEVLEVVEILIDQVDITELPIKLSYPQPLKVHARYTREQILAAFRIKEFNKKTTYIEGAAENKELNTEVLFIELIKSKEDYSPTTMYNDYAISETLFHWQSINSAGPNTKRGQSYLNHRKLGKRMLLFVRERSTDEHGLTMGYVFIGEGFLKEHYGSKPINIIWELSAPIPHYLWKDAAKLAIG